MKKALKMMMALMLISLPFAFVSCSSDDDDDDPVKEMTVEYQVTTGSQSGMTADEMTEYAAVVKLYETAVKGVLGGELSKTFTYNSSTTKKSEAQKQYDNKIISACYLLEDQVAATYPDFSGTIKVVNKTTNTTIYTLK